MDTLLKVPVPPLHIIEWLICSPDFPQGLPNFIWLWWKVLSKLSTYPQTLDWDPLSTCLLTTTSSPPTFNTSTSSITTRTIISNLLLLLGNLFRSPVTILSLYDNFGSGGWFLGWYFGGIFSTATITFTRGCGCGGGGGHYCISIIIIFISSSCGSGGAIIAREKVG